MKIKISSLLLSLFFLASVYGQTSFKSLMRTGQSLFNHQKYKQAVSYFLSADSISKNDLTPALWIGKTYVEMKGEELKAIPYFERALKMRNIPIEVHQQLGTLYHQTFEFDKAIKQFTLYLNKSTESDGFVKYCERMIEISTNAKKVAGNSVKKSIKLLPQTINKGYSEYAPFISADMQTIVFTRLTIQENNEDDNSITKEFMISHTVDGELWEEPKPIEIPAEFDLNRSELAGISQDGFTIFLSIGERQMTNLFSAQIIESRLTNIQQLPDKINSRFGEYGITYSHDGLSCIFSSNRPGGYGGLDLYRSTLLSDGTWSEAVNLGNSINTPFNEDIPFLHPDGKRLIFASEGHRSIGGYDLFTSHLNENGFWISPTSIDFANTVYDDRYFTIDAKGEKAFFAQALNYFPGRYKLFSTDMQDNIPLTMVKGLIRTGTPAKPLKAKIKVYDNETKERIKYAYSPDMYTGKYLMIFPPGRNYDIYIEAEGFMPQLVNVYIPEQKYFYELYQEIFLESIQYKNQRIGENIKVRNTFYDINKTPIGDSLLVSINEEDQKNYDHLLQLIGDIIYQTDSIGLENLDRMVVDKTQPQLDKDYTKLFDLIGMAIESTDSLGLATLDQNTLYDEVVVSPTYYPQGDSTKSIVTHIYLNDTLQTLAPIKTDEQRIVVPKLAEEHDSTHYFRTAKPSSRKYIHAETIYFGINDITLNSKYYPIINQVAGQLKSGRNIGVELHGYTDPSGAEAYNLQLSNRRAQSVMKYILGIGVEKYRIIIAPHGADYSPVELTDSNDVFRVKRRVEIKVFELINHE